MMAQFGVPIVVCEGSRMMQKLLDETTAKADCTNCAYAPEEERELALLMQFMRHDSVASLANAIAGRSGGNGAGADLISAAGLGPPRAEAIQPLVNPRAGLRI
jgi:hypothetical protein